jgi:hypothetical protein
MEETTAQRLARALKQLGATRRERLTKLPGVHYRTLQYWEQEQKLPIHLAELEQAGIITINAPTEADQAELAAA